MAPTPTPTPTPAQTPIPAPALTLPQPGPALAANTVAAPVSSNLDLARRAQVGPPAPETAGVAVATSPPAASGPLPIASPTETPAQAPALATVTPPAPVAIEPGPRRDLASLFGDFRPPEQERTSSVAAVDISKIAAVRPKKVETRDDRGPAPDGPTGTRRTLAADPAASTEKKPTASKSGKEAKTAKAAKPVAPSHPSRIWVQIGVGRDKGALAFDWRRYQRTMAETFKGKKAWSTPWVQTNRLLIGPFDSQAAASALLKELRKKNLDAFLWTSPAGQAVDALAAT